MEVYGYDFIKNTERIQEGCLLGQTLIQVRLVMTSSL